MARNICLIGLPQLQPDKNGNFPCNDVLCEGLNFASMSAGIPHHKRRKKEFKQLNNKRNLVLIWWSWILPGLFIAPPVTTTPGFMKPPPPHKNPESLSMKKKELSTCCFTYINLNSVDLHSKQTDTENLNKIKGWD